MEQKSWCWGLGVPPTYIPFRGYELGLGSALWKEQLWRLEYTLQGALVQEESSPCLSVLLSDMNWRPASEDPWDIRHRCGLLSWTKLLLFSETRAKFPIVPLRLWATQWNCKLLLSQYVSEDNEVGWPGSLLLTEIILHQWFKPIYGDWKLAPEHKWVSCWVNTTGPGGWCPCNAQQVLLAVPQPILGSRFLCFGCSGKLFGNWKSQRWDCRVDRLKEGQGQMSWWWVKRVKEEVRRWMGL